MAKSSKVPRIVYLLPLNSSANTKQLKYIWRMKFLKNDYLCRSEIEQYITSIMSKYEDIEMTDKTSVKPSDDEKFRFKFPYFQFFAHPTYCSFLIYIRLIVSFVSSYSPWFD